MDDYDTDRSDLFGDDQFPLELEFEEPISKPEVKPEPQLESKPEEQKSPFATAEKSPFASQQSLPPTIPPAVETKKQTLGSTPSAEPKPSTEPKIVYYDTSKEKDDTMRLLIFTTVFGLIGAVCFAGISAVYFSIGRRAGILFIAFFATLGARMGTDQLRGNRVRWYAAFTAAGSSFAGKAFLVLLLFNMYPDFTAEDWTGFSNPGKAAAIYFEESVNHALSTDGSDLRSGQERLDDRFEREYRDSGADADSDAWEYEGDSEEEYYEDEEVVLEFSDVFPKLFDVFDISLILVSMFLAFKFAKNES